MRPQLSLIAPFLIAASCGDELASGATDGAETDGTTRGSSSTSGGPDDGGTTSSSTTEQNDETAELPPDGTSSGPDAPACGNGHLDPGEECDEGALNGPGEACKSDCTEAFCGDGEVGPGEECDDGRGNAEDGMCRLGCIEAYCGDGAVGPGEACDDGDGVDGNDCTNTCALPTCGDGVLSAGEECDDGEDNRADGACLLACLEATCGDGHVWAGEEECDDANMVDDDGCSNDCLTPFCGDGWVDESSEECDDGNSVDGDGCETDCSLTCPEQGDTIFVDVNALGAQNGSNWTDAFLTVPAAMSAAEPGDQVWVAQGTYRPSSPGAPVAILEECVDLIGGFIGGEALVSDRPSPLAPTILSGDASNNDALGMVTDNAEHVVMAQAVHSLDLDGFSITGGHADGFAEGVRGAGLYLVDAALRARNVNVEYNFATEDGGGIYASNSQLELIDSSVSHNEGSTGGGIALRGSSASLSNCSVSDNAAADSGGGVFFDDDALVDLTFDSYASEYARNLAGDSGGGLWLTGATATLLETDITDNIAESGDGGGFYVWNSDSYSLDTAVISGNSSDGDGGGAYIGVSTGDIMSAAFAENSSAQGGGLYIHYGFVNSLVDAEFIENTVGFGGAGGGLNATYASLPLVTAEFTDNAAGNMGGAAFLVNTETTFDGSTFNGNTALRGGAINAQGAFADSVEILNSSLTANSANRGGAVYVTTVDVMSQGSTYTANIAGELGGAVYTSGASEFTLLGGTFTGNQSQDSGGALYLAGEDVVIRDGVFETNTAIFGNGGAVRPTGVATPTEIFSSRFTGNQAGDFGGAISGPVQTVLNSVFSFNQAGTAGGALSTGDAEIGSCSFGYNVAPGGGGAYLYGLMPATIRNSAFWGNGGDIGGTSGGPPPTMDHLCTEFFLGADAGVVLATDPFFLGPQGQLFLTPDSACVDNGENALATGDFLEVGIDWSNLTTQQDDSLDVGTVDIGAHYQPE